MSGKVLMDLYWLCLSTDIEGLYKQRRCQEQWRRLRNDMWETKRNDMKSLRTTSTADFFGEWLNLPSQNVELRYVSSYKCFV